MYTILVVTLILLCQWLLYYFLSYSDTVQQLKLYYCISSSFDIVPVSLTLLFQSLILYSVSYSCTIFQPFLYYSASQNYTIVSVTFTSLFKSHIYIIAPVTIRLLCQTTLVLFFQSDFYLFSSGSETIVPLLLYYFGAHSYTMLPVTLTLLCQLL